MKLGLIHIKVDFDPVEIKLHAAVCKYNFMIYCQHALPHVLLYYLARNCHSAFLLSLQMSGKILRGEFYKRTSPKLKKIPRKSRPRLSKTLLFQQRNQINKNKSIEIHQNPWKYKESRSIRQNFLILTFHLAVSKI